jgi:hypothetical protein
MVVDTLRGTFISDGDEDEKGSTGYILALWSVFIAVPKNKLWLTITPEVLAYILTFSKFTFSNHL